MSPESSPDYRAKASHKVLKLAGGALLVTLTGISMACSGISTAAPKSTQSAPSNTQISLTPSGITLSSGAQQQFEATLRNTSNTRVLWHASAGIITDTGLFTAPVVSSQTTIVVSATSVVNGNSVATSQVIVSPPSKLAITSQTLNPGTVGVLYTANLAATGGLTPYRWRIMNGSLPQGLSLDGASGLISGTSPQTGIFSFTASVTDATAAISSRTLSVAISPSDIGNFDGPAELPRVYVQSGLSDTPAPGSVISVPKGGDLQKALNRAKCGDTIELQPGAVYTGLFRLPAQACDDAHWIVIRTSDSDNSLPPEGTRISPCYAGVASLPGRPALSCTAARNVMAKLELPSGPGGPIMLEGGASHYRFIGLEITRKPGTGVVYNLVAHDGGGTADHIVFDRSWLHGTAQDETERGIMLTGTRYAAVVDSYFSDFHCVSITGACGDSQAVAGGLGDNPAGPFKIVNNFLEAAGENVMMGGGAATTTPTDIEIRRNHMFKPMTWMRGEPGYVGGSDGHAFIVKNLLELKNAQRVLIEANIMENSWGGFTQSGFGVLLTPKNQAGANGTNICPICKLTDVTLRYVTISHVGSGMTIGSGRSDNGGVPSASERYSIHDLIVDDIDAVRYSGHGVFAQISLGARCPTLNNIVINHVTSFPPRSILNLGNSVTNPKISRFTFTNSIVNSGLPPFSSTGGGPANCAYPKPPLSILQDCFDPYTFTKNAVIATASKLPPSTLPTGNYFPASASTVEFVSYHGGNGGDYHLQSSSQYKNAGTDGKDLGADIDAIESAVAGVE
jgi:hypothetical protein